MRDLSNVRKVLKLWGNWSNNRTGCGWYNQMAGLKNVIPVDISNHEMLCDDDALVIDKLVACMYTKSTEREMTFFVLSYVYKLNNCEISRRAKCSESQVRQLIMLMESFVGGMLTSRDDLGYRLKFDK